MLHDAGISVAVDHAFGAAIAHPLRAVEILDVAHGAVPVVASPQIEMPVEIEILEAAEAGKALFLAAHETLHLMERGCGIDYLKTLLQRPDLLEGLKQLGIGIVHQVR